MNCKPGDLAVIVRSEAGNEGRIVRCVRLATELECDLARWHVTHGVWVIDEPLISKRGNRVALATDSRLRPITPPAGTITTEEVEDLYSPAPKVKEEA